MLALTLSATDSFAAVCVMGMELLDSIMTEHLVSAAEPFGAFVACLCGFASNKVNMEIAMHAIAHIRTIATNLGEGGSLCRHDDQHILAVLGALSEVAWDSRAPVRSKALEQLLDVLDTDSKAFSDELWEAIVTKIVLGSLLGRVLETPREENEDAYAEWVRQSCQGTLCSVVDMLMTRPALHKYLPTLLDFVATMIQQQDAELPVIGIAGLSHKLSMYGSQMGPEITHLFVENMCHLVQVCLPHELVEAAGVAAAAEAATNDSPTLAPSNPASTPVEGEAATEGGEAAIGHKWQRLTAEQFEGLTSSCRVVLLLIDLAKNFHSTMAGRLPISDTVALMDCLNECSKFAHEFNNNRGARTKLWNPELIDSPPDLIHQEIESLSVYLEILFKVYTGDEDYRSAPDSLEEYQLVGKERLLPTISAVLEQFVTKTIKPTLLPEAAAEYRAFTPVVTQILQGINSFNDKQFLHNVKDLYELLTDLMLSTHLEVRTLLHRIFTRIGAACVLK